MVRVRYFNFQIDVMNDFSNGLFNIEKANPEINFNMMQITINHTDKVSAFENACNVYKSFTFSAIIDMTLGEGWIDMKKQAKNNRIPYIHFENEKCHLIKASNEYLQHIGATDAAMIFKTKKEMIQSLYCLMGRTK